MFDRPFRAYAESVPDVALRVGVDKQRLSSPRAASPAATWTAVVVLPTPPFMFTTAILRIAWNKLAAKSGFPTS